MTQSGFATGAPCWFDVTSPDIPATAAFYSELFGWKADDLGPEAGHYTILSQDGAPVAGKGPGGGRRPTTRLIRRSRVHGRRRQPSRGRAEGRVAVRRRG